MLIINDADSVYTGRDAFPIFVDEIEKVGLFFYIPENFIEDYCVAITCESAQLILEVC